MAEMTRAAADAAWASMQSPATAATPDGAGGSRVAISRPSAFRFGDPEPVLDRRDFMSSIEVAWTGRWYEPPIPPLALARTLNMSAHHRSAIIYKRNQLTRFFVPSRWLSRREFEKFVLNFLLMGNGYLERRDNLAGRPMTLMNVPAIYARVGRDDVFWWANNFRAATEFRPGYVFHLLEDDIAQEIYGTPEWLSALQSGLLNESATIFRRRYYINGSHAGYILYISEEKFEAADSEALEQAMAASKGPGNFRDLYLHIPNGKEKGVQVIPVGEAAAKDDFLNIKSVTRDDLLASHRMPPVLIGHIPQNAGGLGDPAKAADVFHRAEIEPLQLRIKAINDWLGVEAVVFAPYQPQSAAAPG